VWFVGSSPNPLSGISLLNCAPMIAFAIYGFVSAVVKCARALTRCTRAVLRSLGDIHREFCDFRVRCAANRKRAEQEINSG